MTPQTLFYIIISILVVSFIVDKVLDYLNAKHYNDAIPDGLSDVYDADEYNKSQRYKKENYRFGFITSVVSLLATLAFFFFDGFAFVDELARSFSDNTIVITLLFFGIILIASDILSTPFSYYHTFIIEEKYGFNKTTLKTFFLDKVKGWLMMIMVGGILLAAILWLYLTTGPTFGFMPGD